MKTIKLKKSISLTKEEWLVILGWCETYYSEPETEEEKKEYDFYWDTIEKLQNKIYIRK